MTEPTRKWSSNAVAVEATATVRVGLKLSGMVEVFLLFAGFTLFTQFMLRLNT
ncbi:MAG: hypothetical protein ACFB4I_15275 [Cyanophyceae cyanobacterium]